MQAFSSRHMDTFEREDSDACDLVYTPGCSANFPITLRDLRCSLSQCTCNYFKHYSSLTGQVSRKVGRQSYTPYRCFSWMHAQSFPPAVSRSQNLNINKVCYVLCAHRVQLCCVIHVCRTNYHDLSFSPSTPMQYNTCS